MVTNRFPGIDAKQAGWYCRECGWYGPQTCVCPACGASRFMPRKPVKVPLRLVRQ